MHYIKISFLTVIIFLTGCTSTSKFPETATSKNKPVSAKILSLDLQLVTYKEALTALANNKLIIAEKKLIQLTKSQPNLAGPWANLAIVHLRNNKLQQAQEAAQMALAKNDKSAYILNIAGYVEFQLVNVNLAKNYFEQAIMLDPLYLNAHYNLALVFDIYLQDLPMAIQYYRSYLALLEEPDKKTIRWVKELELNLKDN